ncbi:hypothetical protein [Novosphingobium naphthalenivorans]|uniref:hypothetical protein n=1 Tax=Novosphingobium naphthalenivorans TaxID=273168 RepID=UPI0012ED47BF|nr:hypothetical protein [Novosphingobium naphthalenivorans]
MQIHHDRVLGAALAASAALCGMPALASTSPVTAYYPNAYVSGPDRVAMQIDVLASVGGRCGFASNSAPSGTVDAGVIDAAAWSGQIPFTAECTAPWRIAVTSLNGALQAGTANSDPGYTDKAPYTVALNVASDSGTVASSCPVGQIAQGISGSTCDFNGTASASNGLLVPRSYGLAGSYIAVSAPAYSGTDQLIAGSYSDTLTVTISPAS